MLDHVRGKQNHAGWVTARIVFPSYHARNLRFATRIALLGLLLYAIAVPFSIEVYAAAPTVANAIPDQSATAGMDFSYTFPANTFNDSDNDALTYTAAQSDDTDLPAWLTFNATTRTFSGEPEESDVGTLMVKVTASDSSDSVSDTFDLVVNSSGDTTVPTITSSTVNGATITITYSEALDEDSVPTVDGFIVLRWFAEDDTALLDTGDFTAPGYYCIAGNSVGGCNRDLVSAQLMGSTVTLTLPALATVDASDLVALQYSKTHATNPIQDQVGNDATSRINPRVILENLTSNRPPTASNSTVTGTEDTDYAFNPTDFNFMDADHLHMLGVDADSEGEVKIESLPATGTLLNEARVITTSDLPYTVSSNTLRGRRLKYRPQENAFGPAVASFMFRVNDGVDDSTNAYTMTIDIDGTNDVPMVANELPDDSATVGAQFSYTIDEDAFTDLDREVFTYTAELSDGTALPDWLAFDPTTRTFSGTPTAQDVGTLMVRVTARDGGGETVSDDFEITVQARPVIESQNVAPVVMVHLDDGTATVGVEFVYTFVPDAFTDPDGDDLTYAAVPSDGTNLPTWLAFDPTTRTFTGTPTAEDVGTLAVRVTARDGDGETVSDDFEITVLAKAPPEGADATVSTPGGRVYTFALTDFGFTGSDPGDRLEAVKVESLPVQGRGVLEVDGSPILPESLPVTLTRAIIETGRFRYVSPNGSSGTGHADFRFRVSDGTADSVVVYTMTIDVVSAVMADVMPSVWIARFGRTVAEQAIEAVQQRIRAPRTPGSNLQFAGRSLNVFGSNGDSKGERDKPVLAFNDSQDLQHDPTQDSELSLTDWLQGETEEEAKTAFLGSSRTASELLSGASFALVGGEPGQELYTLWGRATQSRFDGREEDLSLDGEVSSVLLGADWMRGPAMAGLIVSHSEGDGGYQGDLDQGSVSSDLVGLYPWGRYQFSDRLSMWGMAGYGQGTLRLTLDGEATMRTDLDLVMAGAGLRGELLHPPDSGGYTLAIKTDALGVRTSTDRTEGLNSAEADVSRLRLALEGSRAFTLESSAVLTPSLEIGLRHDGGDAESGFGADVGAGITWMDEEYGFQAELHARGLLTHEASGFEEESLSVSLAWDPKPSSALGPRLTLVQTLGGPATGGAEALLNRNTLENLVSDTDDTDHARQLELRLGYGYGASHGLTATPELALALSPQRRQYRASWKLHLAPGRQGALELQFDVRRTESTEGEPAREPEHTLGLRLDARL